MSNAVYVQVEVDDLEKLGVGLEEWRKAKRHDDPECGCRWCAVHRLLDELRAENALRYAALLRMRVADLEEHIDG